MKKLKSKLDKEDDYEGKYDADTMMLAHEIMMDPARFKKAHGHIKRKKAAISSIEDLKKAYKKKYSKGMDMDEDMD